MNHSGTLEDLQTIIKGCGFSVGEVKEQEHGYQIRTNEGAIVNWYTSTGKVQVQGKKPVKDKFEAAWGSYTGAAPKSVVVATTDTPAPHAPANPSAANKKSLCGSWARYIFT
ncbi:hypothetical protein [Dickeya ananatis]